MKCTIWRLNLLPVTNLWHWDIRNRKTVVPVKAEFQPIHFFQNKYRACHHKLSPAQVVILDILNLQFIIFKISGELFNLVQPNKECVDHKIRKITYGSFLTHLSDGLAWSFAALNSFCGNVRHIGILNDNSDKIELGWQDHFCSRLQCLAEKYNMKM